MTHLPTIISDLAFMLIVAGFITILFKWLKQPVVLGYIVAGFLVGPYFNFFPAVVDTESVSIWGEIGVIFLLFGMGLEFSFKKLIKNGKTGFICLIMIIIGLGVSGYFLGLWMGWGHWNSLILGCMLCLSSTTIIVKGFEDPRYKGKHFTEVVFGILIFDDLFAILAMVFLGTIAATRNFEGTEILLSLGKLIFFMVVWVVLGIYLIPTFLKKVKKWLNDETLLIVSLGLCLGMVVFATKVELSSALGAFIMGSILAETVALENIERVTKPIKDFFGAIFFVSVGMMMDPAIVTEHFTSIVLISLLVIIGKLIFTTWGARLSGESMLVSVQSGFSMTQVGEFSFIVAGTAIAYGLADNFIYPIIIAVSVLTTFATPYLMAAGDGGYNLMMNVIPDTWRKKIIEKDTKLASPEADSLWTSFLKGYIFNIIIFISLGIAVVILGDKFLKPYLSIYLDGQWVNILSLTITLLAIAPIIKGIVVRKGEEPFQILELWQQGFRNRFILSTLIVIKYLVAFVFIYYILWSFLTLPIWVSGVAAVLLLLMLARSKHLLRLYWNMEYRFFFNFNQRVLDERRSHTKTQEGTTAFDLTNESWIEYNLYVAEFEIGKGAQYEHIKLKDSDFREKYDLLIVNVLRNKKDLYFPSGDFVLEADDIITVTGNIIQINKLFSEKNNITFDRSSMKTIHDFAKKHDDDSDSEVKVISIIVNKHSGLYKKTLAQVPMGGKGRVFVVGIEQNGKYEINPPASTIFQENDIVWIIGDNKNVYEIVKENFHCNYDSFDSH